MTKEQYHEEINAEINSRNDFEVITDQEWEEYEEMYRNDLINKHGYGTYSQLRMAEFKQKNS